MGNAAEDGRPGADAATAAAPVAAAPAPAKPRKKPRSGLTGRLVFLALVLGLVLGVAALRGQPLPLPVWAVAEIESRLNRALGPSMGEAALAVGAVDLTLDHDWVPRLRLEDLRLLKPGGEALLTLPDLRLSLDGPALVRGAARVQSLRIIGAQISATRDRDGRLDIALGEGALAPEIDSLADVFHLADLVLASPAAASLTRIEAEALTLTLTDQRAGRSFQAGDGRLTIDNAADTLGAELALTLVQDGLPSLARLTLVLPKGQTMARIAATVEGIAAPDLAAQAGVLAPLALLDARISGRIAASLAPEGITALEGDLQIGAGALRPTEAARPIVFDRAEIAMGYDAAQGRVSLERLHVESPSLRVKASGQSYLVDAAGQRMSGPLSATLPSAFLTQFRFAEVMVDPEGVFAEPVRFSAGALDARLSLSPFLVEIGQLSLAEDTRRLSAHGRLGADAAGWTVAVDLDLNEIAHDRLLALWPKTLLPRTRDWLAQNILQARLHDVAAALRIDPGAEPRLHLGYSFADAEVRFLRSLPPIRAGYGYSTIEGASQTIVLTRGTVTAPQGGVIDAAGSVFAVPDVTRRPALAEISLVTRSSLTAALSLLDLPPFHFMTKAERPVDLGEGTARIETRLVLPLQKKIELGDVDYEVTGTVLDLRSDRLVAGREIRAERLELAASPRGLSITGAGRMGQVPFDATFTQAFGPQAQGRSRVEGAVVLSQESASDLGLGLPAGMVSGKGQAQVTIDLARGQPGKLRLTSDLNRIGLAIPEIGWSKPAARTGRLEAEVTLGPTPQVDRLVLEAAGLAATGRITLRPGGGLDEARFDRVTIGGWLDAPVSLTGRGAGRPLAIAVKGGQIDLREMPGPDQRRSTARGQGGGPLSLALDRLIVTRSLSLYGLRGDFTLAGGLSGDFTARLNDGPPLRGAVVPARHGSSVRLQAEDAGGVLAAAGVFSTARGGKMDLTLVPRATAGHYDGQMKIANLRVRNASVLAELLNAISVVGILEQLNGEGLVFAEVDGEFLITPNTVQVGRGSAIGASLGVSMAGSYRSDSGALDMKGVVSPVYLLNGIGSVVTRRGEGLFGFNYNLRGTAQAPRVSVNPLSILTPGMFREIFRAAPPTDGSATPPRKTGRD